MLRPGCLACVGDLEYLKLTGAVKLYQDLTQGIGSHNSIGGPHNEINVKDDICSTVSLARKLVQMTFILLKPRSHSAVLTDTVLQAFINFCNAVLTFVPLESLYSRYSNLTSPNTGQVTLYTLQQRLRQTRSLQYCRHLP